jgi:hypothetical protein
VRRHKAQAHGGIVDSSTERNARIRSIAAEIAWLRAEAQEDKDLAFLDYLLGMAERVANDHIAAATAPKGARKKLPSAVG